jgi:glycosyltransferase involved in cell wall biosynthesis
VDKFVAISHYIAKRIWRTYRREADVVYPPVDVQRFRADRPRDDFFLFVSRLVPYKRVDLVVEAFRQLNLPLVVIGDGPEATWVQQRTGGNITYLGRQGDDVVKDHMERCRAFVFAADEDFGIVPVEAQAAGAPVIAFGKGGALETVVGATGDNWGTATGVFFDLQEVQSLVQAVHRFVEVDRFFERETIRKNAERFDRSRFQQEMAAVIERTVKERRG